MNSPTSTAEAIAFAVFAALAVAGAVATVAFKNPIRNAVGLFVHVAALAGLYANLAAHFLVAAQLIVYAGAVVVLFVFVIMLLGPSATTPRDRARIPSRATGALAATVLGALLAWQVTALAPPRIVRPAAFGTLREISGYLFGPAMIPFELASILLVVAVVGAFAVARGHHRRPRPAGPSPADHAPTASSGDPE